jgi:hypothetical protein
MTSEDILGISARLSRAVKRFSQSSLQTEMKKLYDVSLEIGRSWSGSNLGYHARVYYRDFQPPPSGAHFDLQWGLKDRYVSYGTRGDWVEYEHDSVVAVIRQTAGNPDLNESSERSDELKEICRQAVQEISSIIHVFLEAQDDSYLKKMLDKVEGVKFPTAKYFADNSIETKRYMSSDYLAINQGVRLAPHQVMAAHARYTLMPEYIANELISISKQIGSHMSRGEKKLKKLELIGTNVFIGHGRSSVWRDLKDFVKDRLNLPYDEFNRVPVAGFTNIARLSEMLDAAAIAFVVLTAEDETADGSMQARMNVIHEVGLFQGRLGFSKAIVLLEEGCAEFSNIQGLGQIRFPRGNITAKFEEIRQVLEREGLVEEERRA